MADKNISKVVFGGRVLMDLTSDTVTPESLIIGKTAHNAAGEQITGTHEEAVVSSSEITVTPKVEGSEYTPAEGTYYSKVTVQAIPYEEVTDEAGHTIANIAKPSDN